jgi:2-keto-4-pentenoate hydratase/2-oxohepta-3-ene-1,7-dioic acid hydratase in catechol pathway/regulator of RNase E activity RraA
MEHFRHFPAPSRRAWLGTALSYMILRTMTALELVPGKIVAVHASYRSRAAERGTMPAWPSYFLKPSSSLAESGDPVARPPGCELLTFEGEVALVMGRRARRISRADGWDCVAWVTAANDFGVYDLRYADQGSNLRSKGIDGFTPVGPRLLDARVVDVAALRLRTWVNGELAQDAWPAQDMLFAFGDIVADLSRLVTLEPGDVILSGTPTGSTVVKPGDIVEVEVTAGELSSGRLRSPVVEADYRLDPPGAMPRANDAERKAAFGARRRNDAGVGGGQSGGSAGLSEDQAREVSQATLAGLREVSTATLASLLRNRGLTGLTLDGLRSTRPAVRMAGSARTVRYLPLREDLIAAHGRGMNAQKRAIEEIRPGEVLVIEARGDPTAGTIGDILALRAQVRGAVGIVTDGAIRDSAALARLEIPTYHAAVHPAVLGRRHVPWETGVTVACAGVTIQPGDIVVGDADGVVVLPPGIAAEVLAAAREQERQEAFIAARVAAGEPIEGLYPLGERWRPVYEAWLKQQASHGQQAPLGAQGNAQRGDIDAAVTVTMSHRLGGPELSQDAADSGDAVDTGEASSEGEARL